VVEDVICVEVERAAVSRSVFGLDFWVVAHPDPSVESLCVLCDEVESVAVGVGVEVDFEVLVFTGERSRVERASYCDTAVGDGEAGCGFVVGLEVSPDGYAVLSGVDAEVGASHVGAHLERPSLSGACEESSVDVCFVVAFGECRVGCKYLSFVSVVEGVSLVAYAVDSLLENLCVGRERAEEEENEE